MYELLSDGSATKEEGSFPKNIYHVLDVAVQ